MPSTYSSNLKIELMANGENSNTWGVVTNTNLGTALEQAIVGKADITMSSTTVTLSLTNTNAAQNARAVYLNLSGSPGGAADLVVPAIQKPYVVKNGANEPVTVKVSGQTGVVVPVGKTVLLYNNGTDVVTSVDHIPALTLASALPVASGGTGITSFGTGVATALGVNTGSAGAFVVNGGALGTPSSGTLTNATGLPVSTGVSGLGTNVATALAVNVGTAGALVVNGGALGTPSSGTLTNATGLPIVNGTTGTLSVARGGTGATTSTGSGAVVLANSPAFTGSPTAPTPTAGTDNTTLATTAFVRAALNALYPVGSIYINATNSTNPGTLLGFGTWSAFGAGRVPVGFNASDPLFDSAEETGGSKDAAVVAHTHTFSANTGGQSATHTHSGTTSLEPNHSHGYFRQNQSQFLTRSSGSSPNIYYNFESSTTDAAGAHTHSITTGNASADHTHSVSGTTGSTGSSGTNANLQPYITVFMWKRTA